MPRAAVFRAVFRRAILALALAAAPVRAAEPVAVFDMSFINFSQEVEFGATNEAEEARIIMLSDYFRTLLEETGRYELRDIAPLKDEIAKHGEVFTCNACEARLARRLGAERSFTGAVQKLSVLVQTVIIRERDAQTGAIIRQYQTDIRGNTDDAWRRGLAWLVEHRLLVGP